MRTVFARILIAVVLMLPLAARASEDAPPSGTRGAAGSPTWEAIPRAPIAGRIGAGAVWTSAELIVARAAGNPTPNAGMSIAIGP